MLAGIRDNTALFRSVLRRSAEELRKRNRECKRRTMFEVDFTTLNFIFRTATAINHVLNPNTGDITNSDLDWLCSLAPGIYLGLTDTAVEAHRTKRSPINPFSLFRAARPAGGVSSAAVTPALASSRSFMSSFRLTRGRVGQFFRNFRKNSRVAAGATGAALVPLSIAAVQAAREALDHDEVEECDDVPGEGQLPDDCCEGPAPLRPRCCIRKEDRPALCPEPCTGPDCPLPPDVDCSTTPCSTDHRCCLSLPTVASEPTLQELHLTSGTRSLSTSNLAYPHRRRRSPGSLLPAAFGAMFGIALGNRLYAMVSASEGRWQEELGLSPPQPSAWDVDSPPPPWNTPNATPQDSMVNLTLADTYSVMNSSMDRGDDAANRTGRALPVFLAAPISWLVALATSAVGKAALTGTAFGAGFTSGSAAVTAVIDATKSVEPEIDQATLTAIRTAALDKLDTPASDRSVAAMKELLRRHNRMERTITAALHDREKREASKPIQLPLRLRIRAWLERLGQKSRLRLSDPLRFPTAVADTNPSAGYRAWTNLIHFGPVAAANTWRDWILRNEPRSRHTRGVLAAAGRAITAGARAVSRKVRPGRKVGNTLKNTAVFTTQGAALLAASYGLQALVDHIKNDNDMGHLTFAHLGEPCWAECLHTSGWCLYCGSWGRCCRLGYNTRGCDGSQGSPHEHVCVMTVPDDAGDAYEKVLALERRYRAANDSDLDEVDRRHLRFRMDMAATRKAARTRREAKDKKMRDDSATKEDRPTDSHWDPLRFPTAEAAPTAKHAAKLAFAFYLLQLQPAQPKPANRLRRIREEVARFLMNNCIATHPRLYVEILRNLTFSCILKNPRARPTAVTPGPSGWKSWVGPFNPAMREEMGTHTRHTREVSDTTPGPLHMIADLDRLHRLLKHLNVADLPYTFYYRLWSSITEATEEPSEISDLLQDSHEKLADLLVATSDDEHDAGEADDLLRQLERHNLLAVRCGPQRPVPLNQNTVDRCETKYTLIENYLAGETDHNSSCQAIANAPYRGTLRSIASINCIDNGRTIPMMEYLLGTQRTKRDLSPLGPGRDMPFCEELARRQVYPHPLSNLAIQRCIERRRNEVVGVLWYLADEANLLHINRQHIQWLPLRNPRYRRGAQAPSWDPLRLPAAEAGLNPGLVAKYAALTAFVPLANTMRQLEAPAQVTFEDFSEPRFVHRGLGRAAVDVQHVKIGMSLPTEPVDKALMTAWGRLDRRINYLFNGTTPPVKEWRITHPKVDSSYVKYLLMRDQAHDLIQRWSSVKSAATDDLETLAARTQQRQSGLRRLTRSTSEDEQYNAFLGAASRSIPEHLWGHLLSGMLQQHPTKGLSVIFPTPRSTVAVPIGNLTSAIHLFQQEYHSLRGTRSDDQRLTLRVLWNFLYAVAGRSETLREHLDFAKVGRLLAGSRYVGKVVHGGAAALQRAVDRINKANQRPIHTEKWDVDLLIPDTLADCDRLITGIESVLAAAAGGRLHASQLRHLPWPQILDTYAKEKKHGYNPIITNPIGHSTAQTTLSVVVEKGVLTRLEALVWSPLVHTSGTMEANRIIEAPFRLEDGTYATLMPEEERILLVATSAARDGTPWVALTATEFAACRPAGRYHTCPTIRTTRPPLEDEIWPHRDSDVCAYALYAAKTKLAVSACAMTRVHGGFWAKSVDPYSWIVFSRKALSPDIICERDSTHTPRRVQIMGVGILTIPPLCRVYAAGWALNSDRHMYRDPQHTVSHYRANGLRTAWLEVQEARHNPPPGQQIEDLRNQLAYGLTSEEAEYAKWFLPVGLTLVASIFIFTIIVVFGAGYRNLLLKVRGTKDSLDGLDSRLDGFDSRLDSRNAKDSKSEKIQEELRDSMGHVVQRLKLVETLAGNLANFIHVYLTPGPIVTEARALPALTLDQVPRENARRRAVNPHEETPGGGT